jgi:predicted aldo/keto reductase-like oxidoreductase
MIYKKFQDLQLSALGLGTMRLPVVEGNNADIDMVKSAQLVDYAIKNGVNYFDTAWGYHSGNSETAMGELLSNYPRESFYLATKFPGYDPQTIMRKEEVFETQLKKLKTDYFDFYLFHNLCDVNFDYYMDEEKKYGLFEYLMQKKAEGKIRHLGFSVHANNDMTEKFLDKYGEYMEFCQIQLNWLDYSFQDAKGKLEMLKKRNIPVFVMEPVRGGRLVKLDQETEQRLRQIRPSASMPEWAFRYIQSFDEVCVTLSGMSNMAQLEENIKTFSEDKRTSNEENAVLYSIAKDMMKNTVPCTECRYCTEYCPMQLDIPDLLDHYNELTFARGGFSVKSLEFIPEDKRPDKCIGCKSCENVCPQKIKISEVLATFNDMIEKATK